MSGAHIPSSGGIYYFGSSGSYPTYDDTSFGYDCAVAGQPFLQANSPENPLRRGLAPIRKQQVDQSKNPGEQSLDGWWRRSQNNWSNGAGTRFLEPADDEWVTGTYNFSRAVDAWSRSNELKPIRKVERLDGGALASPSGSPSTGAYLGNSGTNHVLVYKSGDYVNAGDTGLRKVVHNGYSTVSSANVAGGHTASVYNVESAGPNVTFASGNSLFKYDGTTVTNIYTGFGGSAPSRFAAWVKERLVCADDNRLYELVVAGGTLPTPFYTHPDTAWLWTSVVSGPNAIYAAGYSATGAAIYKFALDTSGALPTLTAAITVMDFEKSGERVNDMSVMGGRYIAIATNRGLKIGVINDDASLSLGPNIFPSVTDVRSVSNLAPYFVTSVYNTDFMGDQGHWSVLIDVSSPDGGGRFAWHPIQRLTATSTVASECVLIQPEHNEALVILRNEVPWATSESVFAGSGLFQTAYVRFGTLDKKYFHSIRVKVEWNDFTRDGSYVLVEQVSEDGSWEVIGSIYPDTPNTGMEFRVNFSQPEEAIALRFEYVVAGSTYPTITGVQWKALPALERQELIQIPLLCFDSERDKNGNIQINQGAPLTRYNTLRAYVDSGTPVEYQDFANDETYTVVVEELSFDQTSPPKGATGFGGIITVTMRTLQ